MRDRAFTDAIWAAIKANKSEEETAVNAGLPIGWKASATRNFEGKTTYTFTDPQGKRVRSVRELETVLGRSIVPEAAAMGQSNAAVANAGAAAKSATPAELDAAEAVGLPAGWGLRRSGRTCAFRSPSGKRLVSTTELERELGWIPASLKGDRAITEAIFAACAAGKSEEETAFAAGLPADWKASASRTPLGKALYSFTSPEGKKVNSLRAVEEIIGRPLMAAFSSKPPEVGTEHENGTGGVKRKGSGLDSSMSIDGEEQHEGYKLRSCPDQQDACDILPDDVEAVDLEVIGAQIEASGWKIMLREESHHTFSGAVDLSLHGCGRLVVSSRERQLVHSIGRQLANTWLAVE